jgi:glycosyltransferase involved in cell wall biosynthesis
MRVGSVVFGNRWTGAAAVAELHCRALVAADVDARLLFVGGDNLERRLEGVEWASPRLRKERTPGRVVGNLYAVRELAADSEVVLCYLPHDHLLCVAAGVHRMAPLVRAIRSPRHLPTDSYHRFLIARTAAVLPAFTSLGRALAGPFHYTPSMISPVPLDERFTPAGGGEWRRRLEIPAEAPVVGMVGKLAEGRGFDLLLETAARIEPPVHVLLVGYGEAQIRLEILAGTLAIGHRVRWAGYREDVLPALYSAMDVVLFAAPGSDWGHRSISEAQGCGRPVVAAAIPGVEDLIEHGFSGIIAPSLPEALAKEVSHLLTDGEARRRLGATSATVVEDRRLIPSGRRLGLFLRRIVSSWREDSRQ